MHLRVARVAAVALLCLGSLPAVAADRCAPPAKGWGPFLELIGLSQRLRQDQPLTIVALGSSSTQGVGASDTAHTYPGQLERILSERFPEDWVTVKNRGVGGETLVENLARLDREVLALQPHLVIWQVGTNDALRDRPTDDVRRDLLEGIARMRAAKVEVVVLDSQPMPDPVKNARVEALRQILGEAAASVGVQVLSRDALMEHWRSSGAMTPAELLGPDGLHMTDISYRCLAERVADLLPEAPNVGSAVAVASGMR